MATSMARNIYLSQIYNLDIRLSCDDALKRISNLFTKFERKGIFGVIHQRFTCGIPQYFYCYIRVSVLIQWSIASLE